MIHSELTISDNSERGVEKAWGGYLARQRHRPLRERRRFSVLTFRQINFTGRDENLSYDRREVRGFSRLK